MATIREKKSGVWEVRVFTGRDDQGRPTQTSRTVRGGKRDAHRVAVELEGGRVARLRRAGRSATRSTSGSNTTPPRGLRRRRATSAAGSRRSRPTTRWRGCPSPGCRSRMSNGGTPDCVERASMGQWQSHRVTPLSCETSDPKCRLCGGVAERRRRSYQTQRLPRRVAQAWTEHSGRTPQVRRVEVGVLWRGSARAWRGQSGLTFPSSSRFCAAAGPGGRRHWKRPQAGVLRWSRPGFGDARLGTVHLLGDRCRESSSALGAGGAVGGANRRSRRPPASPCRATAS